MNLKLPFAIILGCLLFLGSVAYGNANMLIYPKEGQSQAQQDRDEFECYKWAKEQTGSNQGQTYAGSQEGGEVIRGGARGAALGAVGGAIGGNAGKGAAIGAGVGAVAGLFQRRRNHIRQRERQAQASAGNSDRAYAVCLRGRGYEVE